MTKLPMISTRYLGRCQCQWAEWCQLSADPKIGKLFGLLLNYSQTVAFIGLSPRWERKTVGCRKWKQPTWHLSGWETTISKGHITSEENNRTLKSLLTACLCWRSRMCVCVCAYEVPLRMLLDSSRKKLSCTWKRKRERERERVCVKVFLCVCLFDRCSEVGALY